MPSRNESNSQFNLQRRYTNVSKVMNPQLSNRRKTCTLFHQTNLILLWGLVILLNIQIDFAMGFTFMHSPLRHTQSNRRSSISRKSRTRPRQQNNVMNHFGSIIPSRNSLSSKSLLATVEQSSSSSSSQERNQHLNDSHKSYQKTQPLFVQDMIQTLHSYESNISRTRPYISQKNQKYKKIHHDEMTDDNSDNADEGGSIQIKKQKNPKQQNRINQEEESVTIAQEEEEEEVVLDYKPKSKPISISCMIAIRSFVRRIQQETKIWEDYNTKNKEIPLSIAEKIFSPESSQDLEKLQQKLNNVIIQAIRASADYGDYNMIMNIIESSIEFNTQFGIARVKQTNDQIPLLQARIFGEAITELQRTKANISKIKKVWKILLQLAQSKSDHNDDVNILSTQPSAYELNSMLLAMSRRGRIRAALSLYYGHIFGQRLTNNEMFGSGIRINNDDDDLIVTGDDNSDGSAKPFLINGDTYTASTIMSILAESISNDSLNVQNTNQKKQKKSSSSSSSNESPCWQWREAETILNTMESSEQYKHMLNNHVYAAILKVNDEASDLYDYPGNRHYGSKAAMSILEHMRHQMISPDVVTCSAVMSTFDKGKQWKAALALLKSMEGSTTKSERTESDKVMEEEKKWELPKPNEYSYASAISSCARSGQFDQAIEILDRLREGAVDSKNSSSERANIVPNIWVYNAALASCLPTQNYQFNKRKIQNNLRSMTAIKILRRMEDDAQSGLKTAPDTVTYNTVIATMGGLLSRYVNDHDSKLKHELKHDLLFSDDSPIISDVEINTMNMLQEMKEKSIKRDPITYRNAILACRKDKNAIIRLIDIAMEDITSFESKLVSKWGSVEKIKLYVINVALSICESNGGMDFARDLFKYMSDQKNVISDSSTMSHLLKALGSSGNSDESMLILNAMKGDGAANAVFKEKYGIDLIESGNFHDNPMIHEYHYSSAITCCLRRGELFSALKILNGMKVHGLQPNEESLQGIIYAYCRLAVEASKVEFREARLAHMKKKKAQRRNQLVPVAHTTSRTRATAALAMLKSMNEAPINLQSFVASACAAAGMWTDARKLLWSIHSSVVKQTYNKHSTEPIMQSSTDEMYELTKLHRSLLKLCARSGNVTAALWYARAIQDFGLKLERQKFSNDKNASIIFNYENDAKIPDMNLTTDFALLSPSSESDTIMGVEEWKLVNIAASKSCHWKICLGVLQFIQPYVEMTHPRHACDQKNLTALEDLDRKYDAMARILTDSVLAFELRSQYAWAVRAIYDWIEWSGRRPRREAIYAACRVLARRGLGNQVNSLLTSVLQIPHKESNESTGEIPSYEDSYERGVYTEAITALFQNGLYDNADELYAKAVSDNYLPWSIVAESKSETKIEGLQLDLHGMNKAMAHSAVRVSLQHLVQVNTNLGLDSEITIITGKGKRSSQHLRPVLRPEVQRMLLEEFYPPLGTSSVPGNLGVLKVSISDIDAWVQHQQQQKGVRFLAVADALKTLTSGERLKQLLQKKAKEDDISTEI